MDLSKNDVVDIAELQRIMNDIFNHIQKDLSINRVRLDKDFYWSISIEDRYKLDKDPTDFGVGQLIDDLSFLKNIENQSEAVPAMLIHLGPLLEYLGTQIDWYKIIDNKNE